MAKNFWKEYVANAPKTPVGYLPATLRKRIDKFIQASSMLYVQFGHAGEVHKTEPVAAVWRDLYCQMTDAWQNYDKRQTNARKRKNEARRK